LGVFCLNAWQCPGRAADVGKKTPVLPSLHQRHTNEGAMNPRRERDIDADADDNCNSVMSGRFHRR